MSDPYTCVVPDCWLQPACTTCGKTKAPRGRSLPRELGGTMCRDTCPGYYHEPRSGHLFPGEAADEPR